MKRTLIVYGAQGVGKAPIAKTLAIAAGVPLIDSWNGTDELPAGCVVVTNIRPPFVAEAIYVEVKKYAEVVQ